MTIYEHRATVTSVSGTVASSTLFIPGGLCRQVLIRANTATTLFSANLTDQNGTIRRHYGFHRGEINDMDMAFAVAGSYAITITNASPNDTFAVVFSVQER
mgnify:CR=1 FL=1